MFEGMAIVLGLMANFVKKLVYRREPGANTTSVS
jgi:hypothetical protein